MTYDKVQAAAYAMKQAQAELAEAEAEASLMASFEELPGVFAVMARVPEFGQFVSYSPDGVLGALFEDEAEARRFAAGIKAPAGRAWVIEPVKLYA